MASGLLIFSCTNRKGELGKHSVRQYRGLGGRGEDLSLKKPATVSCYSRECTIKISDRQARDLQPMQRNAPAGRVTGAAVSAPQMIPTIRSISGGHIIRVEPNQI